MTYEAKLAKLLCDYSLNVQPHDVILIVGEACALPLIKACYKAILLKDAHPIVEIELPEQKVDLFTYGKQHQYEFLPEYRRVQWETLNGSIHIDSTNNTKQLTNIEPYKIGAYRKAYTQLIEIGNKRELANKYSWVVAPYPTQAMAQDAEMSFDEYQQFVYQSCMLDKDDPYKHWLEIDQEQKKILEILENGKELQIFGERTEISFNVDGRTWINCSGKRNMPDGEIYTSPVETDVNGTIYFDMPTNYQGVEAEGIMLEIEKGQIVGLAAQKGEKFLQTIVQTDHGSRFIGEIAFGLNNFIDKPTKNILFDEKIGKTIHMAIGQSYENAGGKNKSAIHWDLIKTMNNSSKIVLDGKTIYENGTFILK